jgi:hypothetical protein
MGFIAKLVLVIVVVGAGVWGWMSYHPSAPAQPAQQEVAVQPPAPPPPPPTPADSINASGSSDAALQGDLNTLDTQVQSAQDANASVDQSFNDQPVKQTE